MTSGTNPSSLLILQQGNKVSYLSKIPLSAIDPPASKVTLQQALPQKTENQVYRQHIMYSAFVCQIYYIDIRCCHILYDKFSLISSVSALQ